ncbi:FecR family protein [Pedobacter heparinus]|uniref:FecR protein n=1 Tax=Pedobacter heparinus (strain ATCC 13125 / DSM 2366 / CIP 104194 / JCM 7457 / NBRC 12017 / NCIMB 9290 / NRRL B-14731 / HIM 762-3) TaxID=485917 RepID=C6Y2W4_PEDHD|nr:FecR family protein [Pedobacter heparinus]ACU03177.1 FecR protein [Pedobacter heparinus DSM 2366]
MEKDRLKYLLENYVDGGLSGPELTELEAWYHQLNYGEQKLDQYIMEAGGQEVIINRMEESFKQRIRKPVNIKSISVRKMIAVAAAILLMLSAGLYFYQSRSANPANRILVDMEAAVIKPGGNKAVLTLANGKQINLETASDGQLAETGGVEIEKSADGQVFYKAISGTNHNGESNTISTPNGGQYQIILADGTRVWLNAASSLKYPTVFSGNERKVELIGEAYFEVKSNQESPFLVVSNKQTVKVLGTHFNIKAYPDESFVKTTLLEGRIMVSAERFPDAKILSPGQQAVFDGHQIDINKGDLKEAMAWKNGYFMFKDEDIYSIMNQVSRWYNVEVVYMGRFENKRFGGYVSRSKKITDLLDIMESTKGIHFKIEGRRVTVMR